MAAKKVEPRIEEAMASGTLESPTADEVAVLHTLMLAKKAALYSAEDAIARASTERDIASQEFQKANQVYESVAETFARLPR